MPEQPPTPEKPQAAAPEPAAVAAAPATPPAPEAAKEKPAAGEARARKRQKKNVPRGIAHVKATFNNTIITITDPAGNVVAWDSAGTIGYKGSKKSTPFAAQRASENLAGKVKKVGMREVEVRVKGPGSGRESAVRALQAAGLDVRSIEDVTRLPHNGCRPRKRRRV
ncbi:MAG: 30S ribosomal protein S11 [Planctomycetes bacterium]|nr:30S ribosomal protein S11 [Planctomycetota bacterium]